MVQGISGIEQDAPTGALRGRTALVTGGSNGIGKACVERFRAEGATVFVADLHPRSSDELQLDVRDPAAWDALLASLPPLDLVLLNAGIVTNGQILGDPSIVPLSDVTDEAYREVFGVNVDGVFFGTRAVLPGMVERGHGDILVTASMAGIAGMAADVAYAATKHAVVGIVRSLGQSLGQLGVCISALCPGFVDTQLVPTEIQAAIRENGLPVIQPAQVAQAAMTALAARTNGSQWMVWGDTVEQLPSAVPASLLPDPSA